MKKIILLSCFLLTDFFGFAQVTTAVATVNPVLFEENQQVTISFKLTNPVTTDLYLWAWAQDANGANIGTPNNGAWTSSSASSKLIQTGSSTYAFTYTPSVYYNTTGIAKLVF